MQLIKTSYKIKMSIEMKTHTNVDGNIYVGGKLDDLYGYSGCSYIA